MAHQRTALGATAMKLRRKNTDTICRSTQFNTSSLTEIYVDYGPYEDGSWERDTDYMRNYDVQLPDGSWKDLLQAFGDHDVVPNNDNTHFGLPIDDECRQRGYNP